MNDPLCFDGKPFHDDRGWFTEAYNRDRLHEMGIHNDWMQDNHSFSKRGVIRGIHYQLDGQAKMVRCLVGRIFDVIVDLREGRSFGKFKVFELKESDFRTLYVPPRFGHSFIAAEDSQVTYKVDKPWNPEAERGIAYDDREVGIPWISIFSRLDKSNVNREFILSEKDTGLPSLREADLGWL